MKSKKKLYTILSILVLSGYVWLFFSLRQYSLLQEGHSLCFIKNVFGIPCPSCGITRSIIFLLQGNMIEGIRINPLSLIVLAGMVFIPGMMLYDFLLKKDVLFRFYHAAEKFLHQPKVYIPAIILVIANWLWNIHKQL